MGPTGSNRFLLVCLTNSILVFYLETILKHFLPRFENWPVLVLIKTKTILNYLFKIQ